MTKSTGFDLSGDAMKVVYGFLGVVLLLLFSAELLPEVMNATATIGAIANLPLAGLFSGGVIVMVVVVIVIVSVIKSAGKINK
jgi:uncharacterized membrane protein